MLFNEMKMKSKSHRKLQTEGNSPDKVGHFLSTRGGRQSPPRSSR